ncbi:MAG: B12-binding domain-containing radical SAM protein [Nitrospina sp.]|nr:B12-binding domain-containing radical SAM protein [Nitrospina sp.]
MDMLPSLGRPVRSQNMGKMVDIDLSPYQSKTRGEHDPVQKPPVLLCQFDALEYYSYMLLSTQLNEQEVPHEVEIVDNDDRFIHQIDKDFKDFPIIGFYCCNTDYQRVIGLVRRIKEIAPEKIIILGGPFPTLNYEDIDLTAVDFICIGSGEFYFSEWIGQGHYKKKENFQNIVFDINQPFETKFVDDFNLSPKPNRAIYYDKYPFLKNMRVRRFLLSVGCPYKCTYCHNSNFNDKFEAQGSVKLMFRSPENAIEEIISTLEKYPADAISFSDDNLTISKNWFLTFIDLYIEKVNLPFLYSATVNTLGEEIVKKLGEAKARIARIAMETTNETIRKDILLRPKYTNDEFAEVIANLKKHDIKVVMLNMFAIPTQTLEDCEEVFNFANTHKVVMCTNVLVPYKGTAMYNYCLENDLLVEDYNTTDEGDLYINTASIKGEEMQRMVTMQNYTFLLNYVRPAIRLIKYLSKFKTFRQVSYKYITPINVTFMNFFGYLGLFTLRTMLPVGMRVIKSFIRSN